MAMSSPWAMLITPISPKTIARPSAISTRMVNRLRPLKACIRKISNVIVPCLRRIPHAVPAPRPGLRRVRRGAARLRGKLGSPGNLDLGEGIRLDQGRLVDHVDLPVLAERADARVLP